MPAFSSNLMEEESKCRDMVFHAALANLIRRQMRINDGRRNSNIRREWKISPSSRVDSRLAAGINNIAKEHRHNSRIYRIALAIDLFIYEIKDHF